MPKPEKSYNTISISFMNVDAEGSGNVQNITLMTEWSCSRNASVAQAPNIHS